MKTIIIKEADYNDWHLDAKGETQNAKKRISQGLSIIFILTFYRMSCILANLQSEAVGKVIISFNCFRIIISTFSYYCSCIYYQNTLK